MNKTLAILTALLLVQPAAHAAPSDSERIAELELRVNVLTEQVTTVCWRSGTDDAAMTGKPCMSAG